MKTKEELIKMTDEEFDKFMCQTFPDQFIDRNKPMNETCMCWGFCIGPGWREILYNVCLQLDEIEKAFGVGIRWMQIKEKFGSARFHWGGRETGEDKKPKADTNIKVVWDIISDVIDRAEGKTCHTCEVTGKYYSEPIVIGHWVYGMSEDGFLKSFPDRKEQLEKYLESKKEYKKAKSIVERMTSEEVKDFIASEQAKTKDSTNYNA